MKIIKYLLTTLLTTSLALNASGVSKPQIGDVIRQAQPPKELMKSKKEKQVKIKGIKPIEKLANKSDKYAKTIFIKSFKIRGNKHIKSKTLLSLINSYANKKLSFIDMQSVANTITKEYRKQGYIVARAYIPVQKMNDSILEIAVLEGVYGEFKIKNNSKVKTSLLQKIFDVNKKGETITNRTLERSLLIANDLSGIKLSNISIKAGKSVGSSDFQVTTTDNTKLYNGYLLVSDYGGRYTGENQLNTGVNILNPFHIGDKLSFYGTLSSNSGLVSGFLSYSAPLNQYGLRGEFGYGTTHYKLSKEFASLDALGSARNYHLLFAYPLVKQRLQSLNLSLRLEQNYLTDETRSTNTKVDKRLQAYRLGVDYQKSNLKLFGLNQLLKSSIVFTQGNLKFKDATQAALDKAGADTQGNFAKVHLVLKYNIGLTPKISLENTISLQHVLNNKNLDGSEDFSVGGAYGVKLYPSGELSAENGYLYQVEAKYTLKNFGVYTHKIGFFYDIGRAYMQKPISTFKSRILQDIGLGYHVSYKQLFANLQVARKVGTQKITSEPDRSYRVLMMWGMRF